MRNLNEALIKLLSAPEGITEDTQQILIAVLKDRAESEEASLEINKLIVTLLPGLLERMYPTPIVFGRPSLTSEPVDSTREGG